MLRPIFLTCILSMALSGCVFFVPAVLVVGGATTGGAMIYDQRSFSVMKNDRIAAHTASSWIKKNKHLQGMLHADIAVYDGIGLLVGQAENEEARAEAERVVRGVPNIERMYNGLTIAGQTGPVQHVSDSFLTAKVKSVLIAESGLHSNNMKIVTESGIVYLLGTVSREQADLATQVARGVSGVMKVVTVFRYR